MRAVGERRHRTFFRDGLQRFADRLFFVRALPRARHRPRNRKHRGQMRARHRGLARVELFCPGEQKSAADRDPPHGHRIPRALTRSFREGDRHIPPFDRPRARKTLENVSLRLGAAIYIVLYHPLH